MIELEKNPIMKLGLKIFGKRFFKHYPSKELYFLDGAKRIRDRLKCKVVYIVGVSTLESLETVTREFDFVQMGPSLVKDPAFVNHAKADPGYVNDCDHCNKCATLINHPDGIRSVLNVNDQGRPLN